MKNNIKQGYHILWKALTKRRILANHNILPLCMVVWNDSTIVFIFKDAPTSIIFISLMILNRNKNDQLC